MGDYIDHYIDADGSTVITHPVHVVDEIRGDVSILCGISHHGECLVPLRYGPCTCWCHA